MPCELVKKHTGSFSAVISMLREAELPVEDIHGPDISIFAHIEEQVVCGAVGLQALNDIALIRSLVVSPEYRGRRLGHTLSGFAESEAFSRGFEALYLLTESADRFFERRGYEHVLREDAPLALQRSSQFRKLCPASAHLMCLPLVSKRGD